MSRYVSESLAKEVWHRAGGRCEYCKISIEDTYFGGEIDHIRSLKHNGKTDIENLALACQPCNRNKGSDLGSIPTGSETLVRFYNPRKDNWNEHFFIHMSGEIEPLTYIGQVTASVLAFNHSDRIDERQGLINLGAYPADKEKDLLDHASDGETSR